MGYVIVLFFTSHDVNVDSLNSHPCTMHHIAAHNILSSSVITIILCYVHILIFAS